MWLVRAGYIYSAWVGEIWPQVSKLSNRAHRQRQWVGRPMWPRGTRLWTNRWIHTLQIRAVVFWEQKHSEEKKEAESLWTFFSGNILHHNFVCFLFLPRPLPPLRSRCFALGFVLQIHQIPLLIFLFVIWNNSTCNFSPELCNQTNWDKRLQNFRGTKSWIQARFWNEFNRDQLVQRDSSACQPDDSRGPLGVRDPEPCLWFWDGFWAEPLRGLQLSWRPWSRDPEENRAQDLSDPQLRGTESGPDPGRCVGRPGRWEGCGWGAENPQAHERLHGLGQRWEEASGRAEPWPAQRRAQQDAR